MTGIESRTGTQVERHRVFHLQPAGSGDTSGAPQLEGHGFIHCCTREQITEIASWWFADDGALQVLEIDGDAAGDLRFEAADLGRRYPHLYNLVPEAAVVGLHDFDVAAGLPPALAEPDPRFSVRVRTAAGRVAEIHWSGGRLDGDVEVVRSADELVSKGDDVVQFPSVDAPADLTTAYSAFCVINAVVAEVLDYAGDGWELRPV